MAKHPQIDVLVPQNNKLIQVDEGMEKLLNRLWAMGCETLYSCQGNPRRLPGYILFKKSPEVVTLVHNLIDNYPRFYGRNRGNRGWSIEFTHIDMHGPRVTIRFPAHERERFERFIGA